MKYSEAYRLVKQAADAPAWAPSANVPPRAYSPRPAEGYHTIAKGDSLGVIADKYGVSWKRLAEANPGVSPLTLKLGGRVNIPVPDREWIKSTYKIDPEKVRHSLSNDHALRILYQESRLGTQNHSKIPGVSAMGPYAINKPTFDRAVSTFPDDFKGWTHADVLNYDKAYTMFHKLMQDNNRRFIYLNRRMPTSEELVRMWNQPNAPTSARATKYWNEINRAPNEEIMKAIQGLSPAQYRTIFKMDKPAVK